AHRGRSVFSVDHDGRTARLRYRLSGRADPVGPHRAGRNASGIDYGPPPRHPQDPRFFAAPNDTESTTVLNAPSSCVLSGNPSIPRPTISAPSAFSAPQSRTEHAATNLTEYPKPSLIPPRYPQRLRDSASSSKLSRPMFSALISAFSAPLR